MPQSIAEKFQALWNDDNFPPNVFAFLEQNDGLDRKAQLAILQIDQQHRWKTDQPLKVEDYLARLTDLAADSQCKAELAVGEFLARQNGLASPSIDEFLSRFSDISDTLRQKLSNSDTSHTFVAQEPSPAATETFDSTQMDQRIGRYRIVRVLGEGAFGRVLLAFDEELERQVAIKIPKPERFQSAEDAESYLAEARMVAALDHPNIIPVYDMGRSENGTLFVVSKFIEGIDLKTLIEQERPSPEQAAKLLAIVAQALHHAHQKRVIHRDVKPANILIEEATKTSYVADFGLAIKEEDYLKSGSMAGTPAYMSPEQARGEGHRLDGRSDIFSVGIVFYELLTGKRPFRGSSSYELMVQISTVEPQPPRERDASIPAELERICLKSLSKRASDRYATAAELADDLLYWNQSPQQEHKELQIVPKGLRSFDADDADFFLDLLPGPRNRDGLPESIAFWKSRIEETDPDKTFAVGLVYGPSGCGKSSLIKAGLLPRLSENVVAIYVEATPDETETRILRGLRKSLPELPHDLELVETFIRLRRDAARKVVVVLDQFEQWLHAHGTEQDTELVNALRQCDGEHVQAIVMVRDDFGMAAARFMDALDIPVLQGHNYATVDLFDVDHAEKVLTKFGQAFGKLPPQVTKLSEDENAFVSAVAEGLAQDGKVVSVRLALFAEMVKGKPWTPANLEEVGGTEGIGVNFLEETFAARTANPKHRQHQQATRDVLKCLLPEVGSDIKGHMRSHAELLEVSGYKNRPKEFEELLRILDGELRLITPTDPVGFESDSDSDPHSKYYQLTHDYLVPSLREWLTRKQRETKRGRAELRLAERSALWNAKSENRHLPSLWEWLSIRTLTDKAKWTPPQRKMMRQARWQHGLRSGIALMLLLVLVSGGIRIRDSVVAEQEKIRSEKQAEQNQAEASRLVEGLLKADTSQVPSIVADLRDYRTWANPKLQKAFEEAELNSNAKLHAGLALLPVDGSVLDFLSQRLLTVTPIQFAPVRDMLADHKPALRGGYWQMALDPKQEATRRFVAACVLASFDTKQEKWENPKFTEFLASHLVQVGPADLAPWRDALGPVQDRLIDPLKVIYRDVTQGEQVRSFATDTLADYLSDDPDRLFGLLVDATEPQFRVMYGKLSGHRERAIALGETEIAKAAGEDASEEEKEALAQRQANAAVLLWRLGQGDSVWPLLNHRPDPRLRTWISHRLSPQGASPEAIVKRLEEEAEVSIRRALILTLGEYEDVDAVDREALTNLLLEWYKTDPDAGIHGAAEWVLRQWGQEKELAAIDQELKQTEEELRAKNDNKRDWYINTQGQTFVILEADEFLMGSPESEPDRYTDEVLHKRKIGRRIAISTHEVTKAQWRSFWEANRGVWPADNSQLAAYIKTEDSPMTGMTWFEAAQYCNWLSEQEGIPQDQWCYEPNEQGAYAEGMQAKDKFWVLSGYRLPTEAEWEFACRADTLTSRYYGLTETLLPEYAWYLANGENRTWPVASLKPNDFGLFDMQGNALEWCQDAYGSYKTGGNSDVLDVQNTGLVNNSVRRVLRGGSFSYQPKYVRSASRSRNLPDYRNGDFGFRPSRTLRWAVKLISQNPQAIQRISCGACECKVQAVVPCRMALLRSAKSTTDPAGLVGPWLEGPAGSFPVPSSAGYDGATAAHLRWAACPIRTIVNPWHLHADHDV